MSDQEREDPSVADARMAELLAQGAPIGKARRQLRDEQSDSAEDVLSRLNVLDYLNTVVGDLGGEAPERLGDYRITGLLGRGGMGTVYEAFEESLERTVAVKVLAPSRTADLSMRKRFRTEARASASLHHQHIVPVYGFGESSGQLYFTMERVFGVSLDKHISRAGSTGEKMAPREAARRFAGVADALAHAHKRQILHRDIKPGNILVHPDGSLALADFGLSKILGEASVSMSRTGSFLGTLHYASPEQAKGQNVTAASDLYSLGVTMFEAITGELPVEGKSPEAMLQAILYEPAKRLRSVLPRAPKDLDAVLRKLLEKDPADRYQDGEELARDLMRVADGEPVRIRRQSPFVLLWRTVKKHRALSSAIAVAAVFLLVILLLWRARGVERHENLLNTALQHAEGEYGEPAGPAGILIALTGLAVADQGVPSDVLMLLAQAQRAGRDDPRAAEFRAAYLEDALPEASRSLKLGQGHEALALLDGRIGTERRLGFARRDAATWLRLFRLYLSRAIANLTASVADADAAGDDLLRASFVRPGAFLPAVLQELLSWYGSGSVGERDTDALIAALEGLVAEIEQPDSYREAVGGLVLAFAGLERPYSANLMEFELSAVARKAIHEYGARVLGPRWAKVASDSRTSECGRVEAQLARVATEALAAVGDRPRLQLELSEGREHLAVVGPASPLRSWEVVYRTIENSGITSAELDDRLSEKARIRGLTDVLELNAPVGLVRNMESAVRMFDDRTSIDALRLRAQWSARVADDPTARDEALRHANQWVQADSGDPEAYLCRFLVLVKRGEPMRAGVDLAVALQRSVDAAAMRDRILAVLVAYAEDLEAEKWARQLEGGGR